MRRNISLLMFLLIACFSTYSRAQQWSGILSPSRAADWSSAGVTGGIPSDSWTQCGSTISAGASASTIQGAINACTANHYVLLAAGSYSLNTGLNMKSGVVLRGAGANKTTLNFSGTGKYYWGEFYVGFQGSYTSSWAESAPGPATGADPSKTRSWTGTNGNAGTYTQGATVLNLDSAPTGLLAGDMLELTQKDDSGVSASGILVCADASGCSREGSGYTHATAQRQNVKVVSINGSAVTITPGIYAPNWRTSQNPKANWWGGDIRMAGVEDLRINGSTEAWAAVLFWHAADCWLSGVAIAPYVGGSGSSTRHGVLFHITRNITMQNSWLDRMAGGGSGSTTSYGIAPFGSSATLILNNIVRDVESPMLSNTAPTGDVIAYNYVPNVCTAGSGCSGLFTGHEVGSQYLLLEGNAGTLIRSDTYHGTHNLWTIFRNYLSSSQEAALDIQSHNRYVNVVGNVLGSSAPTNYECEHSTAGNCGRYNDNIYRLGYPGSDPATSQSGVSYDDQVKITLMRWGNYDTKTATSRFEASEVPSGIGALANPVPADNNLPASFYLNAKPNWWPAAKPWPPIGPDVTGGNISGIGGHANTLPAQDCYASTGGNIGNFNADSCYPQSGSPALAPPTGVTVTVQ